MSDVDNKVKMVVEGLLLAAGRPLTLDNIAQVFNARERPDRKELLAVMAAISAECDDRGFELTEVASGYRFQVKQELSEWVAKLWEERPPRYTRALLETLALIAYRQPITRGDIEEIRGVGVSPNIIRTLLDREWVRVVGHRDVPGRPAMFATTRQFLDYFNLKNLQDLPPLSEIKDLERSDQELDLADDLAERRVLELPEEGLDENSYELSAAEEAELLAEEEAVELSKKPLDEILRMGMPEELQKVDDEFDEDDEELDEVDEQLLEVDDQLQEVDQQLNEVEGQFKKVAANDDSESGSPSSEDDTGIVVSEEGSINVDQNSKPETDSASSEGLPAPREGEESIESGSQDDDQDLEQAAEIDSGDGFNTDLDIDATENDFAAEEEQDAIEDDDAMEFTIDAGEKDLDR